jgi:hypothetical protein
MFIIIIYYCCPIKNSFLMSSSRTGFYFFAAAQKSKQKTSPVRQLADTLSQRRGNSGIKVYRHCGENAKNYLRFAKPVQTRSFVAQTRTAF